MNTKSGREVLKCVLHLKTLQQDRNPLKRDCFRVVIYSVIPFTQDTYYQIGGRYTSTAAPHAKRRCSIESAATLPAGA